MWQSAKDKSWSRTVKAKGENGKEQKLASCQYCAGICVLRYHSELSCRHHKDRRKSAPINEKHAIIQAKLECRPANLAYPFVARYAERYMPLPQ